MELTSCRIGLGGEDNVGDAGKIAEANLDKTNSSHENGSGSASGDQKKRIEEAGGKKSGPHNQSNGGGGKMVLPKNFYLQRQGKSCNFRDDSPVILEAFNSELINLHSTNSSIPDKPLSDLGPFASLDDYLLTVNQHKKFHRRREKLYFTQGPNNKRGWIPGFRWCLVLASMSFLVLGSVGIVVGYTYFSPSQPQHVNSFPDSSLQEGTSRPASATDNSNVLWQQTSEQTSWSTENSVWPPEENPKTGTLSTTTASPGEASSASSSGSFVPVITNNFVPSAAEISFSLTNAQFNETLGNSSSQLFADFAAHIQSLLTYELENFKGWLGVKARVTEFMPGSIVVKMKVSWKDRSRSLADLQIAMSSLRQLGSYDVMPGFSYGIFDLCKFQNHGCSHVCYFDYQQLDFQCLCPQDMEVSAQGKVCVKKQQQQLEQLQASTEEQEREIDTTQVASTDQQEKEQEGISLADFSAITTPASVVPGFETGDAEETSPAPQVTKAATETTTSTTSTTSQATTAAPITFSSPTTTTTVLPITISTTTTTSSPPPLEPQGIENSSENLSSRRDDKLEQNTEPGIGATGASSYENSVTDYMLNIKDGRTEDGIYSQIQDGRHHARGPSLTSDDEDGESSAPAPRIPRFGFSNISRYSEEANNLVSSASDETSTAFFDDQKVDTLQIAGSGRDAYSSRLEEWNQDAVVPDNTSDDRGSASSGTVEVVDSPNTINTSNEEREREETTARPVISLVNDTAVNDNAGQKEISAEAFFPTTTDSGFFYPGPV